MSIVIKERSSDLQLAKGEPEADVVKYEGNWYFLPSAVDQNVLKLTDRTYTCPYKGTCHWVDVTKPDGSTVKDVAWVYAAPKAGHEILAGRYGFYAGSRGATKEA